MASGTISARRPGPLAAWFFLDATLATRTRAFGIAAVAHAALLTAFVVLWSGGVPLMPGDNLYEQLRLIDVVVLLLLLPWVASRCGADDHGDRLVVLSALTATPPSRIVLARLFARLAATVSVVIAGGPQMIAAQQMSDVPAGRLALDLLPLFALAALASAAALAWSTWARHAVVAWTCATASTMLLVHTAVRSAPAAVAPVLLLVTAIAAAAWVVARADTTYAFLSEPEP